MKEVAPDRDILRSGSGVCNSSLQEEGGERTGRTQGSPRNPFPKVEARLTARCNGAIGQRAEGREVTERNLGSSPLELRRIKVEWLYQSTLIPVSLRRRTHLVYSSCRRRANSSGVLFTTSAPI